MKIIEQVSNILRASYKARNSDKVLYIIYMQKFGLELTDQQVELFKKMPSLETIRRTRQLLQEQGKYPASKEVDEHRYQQFKEMRQTHAQDPEKILEAQGKVILPWGK